MTQPPPFPAPEYRPPLPYAPPVSLAAPPAPHIPRRQGTNGFAIASLVLGLVGGILLSVVFGIVALVQIRREGQGGKGLAIAGLALSGAWVMGIAGLIAVAIAGGADRDSSGRITIGGSVSVRTLAPGDCVNGIKEGKEIASLPAVPCAEPHEGEVFAVFELTGSAWPGDEAVFAQAEQGCLDRLSPYSATAADDESLEILYLHPTQSSWRRGDHGVSCLAVDPAGKRTGSLRD